MKWTLSISRDLETQYVASLIRRNLCKDKPCWLKLPRVLCPILRKTSKEKLMTTTIAFSLTLPMRETVFTAFLRIWRDFHRTPCYKHLLLWHSDGCSDWRCGLWCDLWSRTTKQLVVLFNCSFRAKIFLLDDLFLFLFRIKILI
jgi:hypothetical protein